MKRKITLIASFLTIIVFICCILTEFLLRLFGFNPYLPNQRSEIEFYPNGVFYQKDTVLGWKHIEGEFNINITKNYSWKASHLTNTYRITRPKKDYSPIDNRPKIWFMGCSYTHGWSLNDSETFPWILQKNYPKFNIENFGVGAYGSLHSLLQLKRELQNSNKPKYLFLNYASFHDERSTMLGHWRKALISGKLKNIEVPYARIEKDSLKIKKSETIYSPWFFNKYSATVNLMENSYYNIQDYFVHSQDVSIKIIEEIIKTCTTNNIEFFLLGIHQTTNTSYVLNYFREKDVNCLDISVDLINNKNLTNHPYDPHPGVLANIEYAKKIDSILYMLYKNEK